MGFAVGPSVGRSVEIFDADAADGLADADEPRAHRRSVAVTASNPCPDGYHGVEPRHRPDMWSSGSTRPFSTTLLPDITACADRCKSKPNKCNVFFFSDLTHVCKLWSGPQKSSPWLYKDHPSRFSYCEPDQNQPGAVCNASAVQLDDFEVWRREEGYWIGEYTLTGSDGNPFQSSTWNYPYGSYKGFIHLELNGPSIRQRNVFLYPPSTGETDCDGVNNVTGDGVCGTNGNEKIFAADQNAADCDGNLAGPYQYGAYTVDTETTVTVGAGDTVIYQVRLPAAYGGALIQNQLTSLPTPTKRTRTAQGFNPATGDASYASFYRENKVSQSEFAAALVAARAAYNIRPEDYCGWTDAGPSGKTCQEHFNDD